MAERIAGRVKKVQAASGVGHRDAATEWVDGNRRRPLGKPQSPARGQVAGQPGYLAAIVGNGQSRSVFRERSRNHGSVQFDLTLKFAAPVQEHEPRMGVPGKNVAGFAGQRQPAGRGAES